MLAFVKFLHFSGLMLGAGAGLGSLAVARQIRRARGTPAPQLAALRPFFAHLALSGIVLLWLTGLWLYFATWRGTDLGSAFHAKLGVAALVLAIILVINLVGRSAAAKSLAPPAWLPKLGLATPVLTLIAVALAVYVFE